jgi:hypothetical protein
LKFSFVFVLEGSAARIYPPNLLKIENNTVPLSSTPIHEKPPSDQTFNAAIEEHNFPQLPSPPPEGDDE